MRPRPAWNAYWSAVAGRRSNASTTRPAIGSAATTPGGELALHGPEGRIGRTVWRLSGEHNRANACAALLAARHVGVPLAHGLDALSRFVNVKRRMEVRGEVRGVTVYDDFAHHPTAIATTVAGLRRKVGNARILAVLEPRSNTMKLGTMKAQLPDSLREVDMAFCYAGNLGWDAREALAPMGERPSSKRIWLAWSTRSSSPRSRATTSWS